MLASVLNREEVETDFETHSTHANERKDGMRLARGSGEQVMNGGEMWDREAPDRECPFESHGDSALLLFMLCEPHQFVRASHFLMS
jgi:hypothetical protein